MSELPDGWANASLAAIAEVQLGRQRSPKNHFGPNMRPYLRAANVTWNGLALDDVKEMNFSSGELATFRLAPGDILLSEASGTASEVGKPAIWRGEIDDCCFQNTLLRVRTRHLDRQYLLWFFRWLAVSGQFARGSRGVGIHHLGATALSEWCVPVAPRKEQKRIVAVVEEEFSRLDAGVAALERVQKNSQRMRAASYQELYSKSVSGAALTPVGELCEFIVDGDHNPPRRTSAGIPYLTAKHVKQGAIATEGASFISEEDFASVRHRYDPQGGDVLVTCVGTLGEVAIVPDGLIFAADRNLAALRPKKGVAAPAYIEAILRAPRLQRLLTVGSGSTAQPHLYLKDLRRLEVPAPPIAMQERLLVKLNEQLAAPERLDAAITVVRARANLLRAGILDAAFSGKLVAQDLGDEAASALVELIAAERVSSNGRRPRRTRNHGAVSEKVTA